MKAGEKEMFNYSKSKQEYIERVPHAREGFLAEERVKEFFVRKGYEIKNSTEKQDIYDDIDFFAVKEGKCNAVSVKNQKKALETGELCFELETYSWGTWKQSTFYTSKADAYAMVVGDEMLFIPSSRIKEYVKAKGFTKERTLTKKTIKENQANHIAKNTKVGIISISKLINSKVATKFKL